MPSALYLGILLLALVGPTVALDGNVREGTQALEIAATNFDEVGDQEKSDVDLKLVGPADMRHGSTSRRYCTLIGGTPCRRRCPFGIAFKISRKYICCLPPASCISDGIAYPHGACINDTCMQSCCENGHWELENINTDCDNDLVWCFNYPLCWIQLPGAGSDPSLVAGICSPFKKPNGWKERTLCGKPIPHVSNCCSDGCNCYYPTGRDGECSASGCKVGSVIGVCAPPSEPPTPAKFWNNHGTGWGCGDSCECYTPVVSDLSTTLPPSECNDPSVCSLPSPWFNITRYGICSNWPVSGWTNVGRKDCQTNNDCECYLAPDSCSNSACEFGFELPPPDIGWITIRGICAPRANPPPSNWINRGSNNGCSIDCDCYTQYWDDTNNNENGGGPTDGPIDWPQCNNPPICNNTFGVIEYGICINGFSVIGWTNSGRENCENDCQCNIPPDPCKYKTCYAWGGVQGICAPKGNPPPHNWNWQGQRDCADGCECYTKWYSTEE